MLTGRPFYFIYSPINLMSLRVILSARSEWFRRALQSGMIEDRDRK